MDLSIKVMIYMDLSIKVILYGKRSARLTNVNASYLIDHYYFVHIGEALFFHANLVHTSAPNDSPRRRWALLHSYNTKSNNPVKIHHHAQYTPLSKVNA